jgi:hypothetical protein
MGIKILGVKIMGVKILLVFILMCGTATAASAQRNTDVPLGPAILRSDKIAPPPSKVGSDSGAKDSKSDGESRGALTGAPSGGTPEAINKPAGKTFGK